MIDALLTLIALAGVLLAVPFGILCAVWAGSWAYVVWRTMKRDDLYHRDRMAWVFLGPYRSPFPWHKDHSDDAEQAA